MNFYIADSNAKLPGIGVGWGLAKHNLGSNMGSPLTKVCAPHCPKWCRDSAPRTGIFEIRSGAVAIMRLHRIFVYISLLSGPVAYGPLRSSQTAHLSGGGTGNRKTAAGGECLLQWLLTR